MLVVIVMDQSVTVHSDAMEKLSRLLWISQLFDGF